MLRLARRLMIGTPYQRAAALLRALAMTLGVLIVIYLVIGAVGNLLFQTGYIRIRPIDLVSKYDLNSTDRWPARLELKADGTYSEVWTTPYGQTRTKSGNWEYRFSNGPVLTFRGGLRDYGPDASDEVGVALWWGQPEIILESDESVYYHQSR